MAASTFFIPSVNVIGADSLNDAMNMMADYGFTRTLIVTDNMLTKLGMAGDVQKALEERNIFSVIYDGTQPNPTTENVAAGLKLLKENNDLLRRWFSARLRKRYCASGSQWRRYSRLRRR